MAMPVPLPDMIRVYSPVSSVIPPQLGEQWIQHFQGKRPVFACVFGFTKTALIPGISAAGATPSDRQTTALADAEFLYHGSQPHPQYPLPPLDVGISPAFISRAIIREQNIPLHIFNAGLPHVLPAPHVDLGGSVAQCVRSGQALSIEGVEHLFQMGLQWGDRLGQEARDGYVIIGECVVGGTTTALAILTGLGWSAMGKVNSSHPTCNHDQKAAIVNEGLRHLQPCRRSEKSYYHPKDILAAVGDPMQPVVAGMAIAASRHCGVLLAGGTQMLAVYALMKDWTEWETLSWCRRHIAVGTTRWVVNDPTGGAISLAQDVQAPLLATQFSVQQSQYPQLKIYDEGFVKEGVGAGGCAIAATLYRNWSHKNLIDAIERLLVES